MAHPKMNHIIDTIGDFTIIVMVRDDGQDYYIRDTTDGSMGSGNGKPYPTLKKARTAVARFMKAKSERRKVLFIALAEKYQVQEAVVTSIASDERQARVSYDDNKGQILSTKKLYPDTPHNRALLERIMRLDNAQTALQIKRNEYVDAAQNLYDAIASEKALEAALEREADNA